MVPKPTILMDISKFDYIWWIRWY